MARVDRRVEFPPPQPQQKLEHIAKDSSFLKVDTYGQREDVKSLLTTLLQFTMTILPVDPVAHMVSTLQQTYDERQIERAKAALAAEAASASAAEASAAAEAPAADAAPEAATHASSAPAADSAEAAAAAILGAAIAAAIAESQAAPLPPPESLPESMPESMEESVMESVMESQTPGVSDAYAYAGADAPGLESPLVAEPGEGGFDLILTPGESLSASLAAAAPGAKVLLSPGVYPEPVVLEKEVHVFGQGRAVLTSPWTVVTSTADSATLDGVVIRCTGGSYGLEVTSGALRLQRCDVSSSGPACVLVAGVESRPILVRNHIHDSGGHGVSMTLGAGGRVEQNLICNHAFSGVALRSGADPAIEHNDIRGNNGCGVYVGPDAPGEGVGVNAMAGNKGGDLVREPPDDADSADGDDDGDAGLESESLDLAAVEADAALALSGTFPVAEGAEVDEGTAAEGGEGEGEGEGEGVGEGVGEEGGGEESPGEGAPADA